MQFLNLKYNAEVVAWIHNNEVQDVLNSFNDKRGIFKNKFNNKINICIGIAIGDNQESTQLIHFLGKYRTNDGELIKTYTKSMFKLYFKDAIYRVLNDGGKSGKKNKSIRAHLRLYLHKLSENNMDEAIDMLFEKVQDNINFIFFSIHALDKEAVLSYEIKQSPSLVVFVNTGIFEGNKIKSRCFLKHNYILNINQETWDENIKETIIRSIEYYFRAIFDFDN